MWQESAHSSFRENLSLRKLNIAKTGILQKQGWLKPCDKVTEWISSLRTILRLVRGSGNLVLQSQWFQDAVSEGWGSRVLKGCAVEEGRARWLVCRVCSRIAGGRCTSDTVANELLYAASTYVTGTCWCCWLHVWACALPSCDLHVSHEPGTQQTAN